MAAITNSGADAIEALKLERADRGMPGGPDIIVSDLFMAPINGLLLLRWVRMAKESPNRFVPFVMLSGAADGQYVRESRDLGVSEFLAKPFSGEPVYKRILEVIDHPRQFVITETYCGPDRRRRKQATPGDERRVMDQENVTVVYSADKVVKPKTASDVWHFRLPNGLKERAGGGGRGVRGELPLGLLAEAEEQLERAALGFTEWAADYLGQLSRLCDDALAETGPRDKQFTEINLLAHELRGQGGTFGYPLITIFGKMLYDCSMEGCAKGDSEVEIVKAHVDAMRAVLREKVSGDGGDVGRALLESLKQAIARRKAG